MENNNRLPEKMQDIENYTAEDLGKLPVIPLKGLSIFPYSMVQLEVARPVSIHAITSAMNSSRKIFAVAQLNPVQNNPKSDDLYKIGTFAKIIQMTRQADESLKVVLEGECRAVAYDYEIHKSEIHANIVSYIPIKRDYTNEEIASMGVLKQVFSEYTEIDTKTPKDVGLRIGLEHDPGKLSDFIASNSIRDFEAKQLILELFSLKERIQTLTVMLRSDVEILKLQQKIMESTATKMDDNQREFFLREQIRSIREELGEEELDEDVENLLKAVRDLKAPDEIKQQLFKECSRLRRMMDSSQEAYTLRTYIETCLELPWSESTKTNIDIKSVERTLNSNHYGLKEVKERILEYLAVRKLMPETKGQIICLVGPPGVGKTSIAQSIGAAINRKVERIALGGVHDEAEIRGHRRTYVAAMPGRIISAIKASGVNNPLIILDEIDKLGSDHRGDPTSALLEVLDPEQNHTFKDHYIDMAFDLSNVMFITTANDQSEIPSALRDRMEVIELSSYTREEKFNIAKKHLIPKQITNTGLLKSQITFTPAAIYSIVDGYTSEAGVRELERKIAAVLRKMAKKCAENDCDREMEFRVDGKNIEEYLGVRKYKDDTLADDHTVGYVNGLAWTAVGGVTLPIEAVVVPGDGKITITGSLGDVMKESAKIAVTCVRDRAQLLDIADDFYNQLDIHIHALEGAVPKDGPSAGITMTTALVSALTKKPVNKYVAMTGEISLRGMVLPIGGLKEKAMGAYKAGIRIMIIPKKNEPDMSEIDDTIKEKINIIPVETIDEVFEIAFSLDDTYVKKLPEKKKPGRRKKTAESSAVNTSAPINGN